MCFLANPRRNEELREVYKRKCQKNEKCKIVRGKLMKGGVRDYLVISEKIGCFGT